MFALGFHYLRKQSPGSDKSRARTFRIRFYNSHICLLKHKTAFLCCVLYNEMQQEAALFDQMSKLIDNIWRGQSPIRNYALTYTFFIQNNRKN